MKKLLFLIAVVFVLLYIFIHSGTLETQIETKTREDGIGYDYTRYSLHWDRFVDYSEEIPGRVERLIKQWTGKY